MSRNLDLNVLHVDDATAWADNVAWRPVSGDTLVFDYVYFLHPVRPQVHKGCKHCLECMLGHVFLCFKFDKGCNACKAMYRLPLHAVFPCIVDSFC